MKYCNYKLSKALKEAGFDLKTREAYNTHKFLVSVTPEMSNKDWENQMHFIDEFSAPTIYEAAEWFRDVHGIHVNPVHAIFKNLYGYKITKGYEEEFEGILKQDLAKFKTHNEALHAGLEEAIELIKTK